MARKLVFEKPLMVKLDPELKQWLKAEAAESETDMSKLVRELLIAERARRNDERRRRQGRGARLVEHMTGRATSGMTTDEIMALTRGDD